MSLHKLLNWFRAPLRQPLRRDRCVARPRLVNLEERTVPAGGYLAVGAGPGSLPLVAIRVDTQDAVGGSPPNSAGSPAAATNDLKTDFTSQIFMPFAAGFRGGVHVATGNFDGSAIQTDGNMFPDQLITAAGPGGGPHVIIWKMREINIGDTDPVTGQVVSINTLPADRIVTDGILDQFFAFDPRFAGGVNVTAGDLDGDGVAELICAAGPGGGPHVKIYKFVNESITDVNGAVVDFRGHFELANQFYAYDPNFKGGVSIASGQGYSQETVIAQLTDSLPTIGLTDPVYPAGVVVPGSDITPTPQPLTGIYTDPADNIQKLYHVVGAGTIAYLGANLTQSYGDTLYRTTQAGTNLVYAKWDSSNPLIPTPPGFTDGVLYGPFLQVTQTDPAIITRLLEAPGASNTRNQLITGAGPGGGPHVRIWDFGTNNGLLVNNGVASQFYAFDQTFTGGVNVAIGDFISTAADQGTVARDDTNIDPNNLPQFPFNNTPTATNKDVSYLYKPEILCSMASKGSRSVVISDLDPLDVMNNNGFAKYRNNISEIAPGLSVIDAAVVFNPNSPLTGFNTVQALTYFARGTDPNATNGSNAVATAFGFNGSAASGLNAQTYFSPGTLPSANSSNPSSTVRGFLEMSPLNVTSNIYNGLDEFSLFDALTRGASLAYGFGELPVASIDFFTVPSITVNTVTNPRLV